MIAANRRIDIKYLLILVGGLCMAMFAFYYSFFMPDPVAPEALRKINGTLGEVQLEQGKNPRLLFQMKGFTVTFVVGASYDVFDLENFLANERSHSWKEITATVNAHQLENPRKVPINPALELVEVYALSSPNGVYLKLENSREEVTKTKRMAVYLGVFLLLCVGIIFYIAFPVIPAYGQVEVPLQNVFYGYQPFMWKTDRLYIFRVVPHQLEGAYIGGQVMSPEPMEDPLMFARKDLLEKYMTGDGPEMPWAGVDMRNLLIGAQDLERIEVSPKSRVWVAPHPNAGTLYFYRHDGSRLQFILIGNQSLQHVKQLLTDNRFNLTDYQK